jgi:hypothetical protein
MATILSVRLAGSYRTKVNVTLRGGKKSSGSPRGFIRLDGITVSGYVYTYSMGGDSVFVPQGSNAHVAEAYAQAANENRLTTAA